MYNKKFTAFLAAVKLFSTVEPTTEKADFIYTVIDNEVTITGFTGEPTRLEIPSTIEGFPVTKIRDNAFYKCTELAEITLPITIDEIGHHTFYGCKSLESITLPQELKSLGMGAFDGCASLVEVNFPDTLTTLPEDCFQSCSSLTEVEIPCGVSQIGADCFKGCRSLTYISLSDSVTEIGEYAFYMCDSLESLYIPSSVHNIGGKAAGYNSKDKVVGNFTILGAADSAASIYARDNGLSFTESDGAVRNFSPEKINVKEVPDFLILLFAAGGIGFFAVSCVIAAKEFSRRKEAFEADSTGKQISQDSAQKR